MSTLRPFSDLNSGLPDDIFTRAANELRSLACRAYGSFPELFLPPALPGLGGVRRANQAFWDNTLCPMLPPSTGNRVATAPGCENVLYDVGFTNLDLGTGLTNTGIARSANGIVRAEVYPIGNIGVRLDMINLRGENVGQDFIARVPPTYPGFRPSNVFIQRRDGLPLNTPCSTPPTIDPDIIFPPFITVEIGGNQEIVNIDNVTWEVEGDTNFSPTFNTSLGGFEFSLGGVNLTPVFLPQINIGGGTGGGITPGQVADIIQTANDLQTTTINQNTDTNLQALADFVECLILKPDEQITSQTVVTNTEGGVFNLPAGTFAVVVSINGSFTIQTRVQSGSGNAPNVIYWGWFSFGRNGNQGVRKELQFADTFATIEPDSTELLINPIRSNRANAIALIKSNSCEFSP